MRTDTLMDGGNIIRMDAGNKMIINLLINVLVLILGAFFSLFPIVTELPEIVGYDLDGSLLAGMGYINTFLNAFWPIAIMFQGFLVILGYFLLKMVLKAIFGHRAPQ